MTRTLTLKNRFQGNTTIVENDFIDHYMAKANGEYVKVYLLLLRHLNANSGNLSICGLADCLECTEKDILRAFTHWSEQGLLKIDYDDAGNICGLAIGKPVPKVAPKDEVSKDAPRKVVPSKPVRKDSKDQEDLRQLYFVAEQYVGKPLTVSEIKKINYFFDTLGFSTDLIEYLIEYCVSNRHTSIRYIEKVAISWYENGYQTIEQVKQANGQYNQLYSTVMKSLGISGRNLVSAETAYIEKWKNEFGFSIELIQKACEKTIH